MSADVQQLLAAQADVAENGAGGPDVAALLDGLAEENPKLQLLVHYFRQRQVVEEAESDVEADEPDEAADAAAQEALSRRRRAYHRLRELVEGMYAELEALRTRNDDLAAALGACYLCWGEDTACPVCGGAGAPGAALPDRELFAQLAVPAGRRLRQALQHPARSRSGDMKKA